MRRERSKLTCPQLLPWQEDCVRLPRTEGDSGNQDQGDLGQGHQATWYERRLLAGETSTDSDRQLWRRKGAIPQAAPSQVLWRIRPHHAVPLFDIDSYHPGPGRELWSGRAGEGVAGIS